MKVKSSAEGDRGINVMINGKPDQMLIHPGQEVDIELVDKSDKVFYGMVAKREMLLEEQMVVPKPPAAPDPVEQAPQTSTPTAAPAEPAKPEVKPAAPMPADPKK